MAAPRFSLPVCCWVILLGSVLGGLGATPASPLWIRPPAAGPLAPPPELPPAPESIPEPLRRGYQLAHVYCQACHLFPEPDLLNRETWRAGALRKMAPLLGAGRVNLDRKPDGEILKAAGIFPDAPLLPESEWLAICDYYERSAPLSPLPQRAREPIAPSTPMFRARAFTSPSPHPAVTLLRMDPQRRALWVGSAQQRCLDLYTADGRRVHRAPMDSPPVSITTRKEGHYVTLIGDVFPSDERKGRVVLLEETPDGTPWRQRVLVDGLQRPVETTLADLNGDGREDLVVSCFGNYLGRLSWHERDAGGRFLEHVLIGRPGALGARPVDLNGDGRVDLVALMAQAREGVYFLSNQGGGDFEESPAIQFPPVHGSTHFEWIDFNGDGFPDLLLSNGDNGEYASPFKNYHGLRLFLNDGKNRFAEAWFYPLNGAFKAVAADFDGDGDLDIAAISFFPAYGRSPEESFVYLENLGGLKFKASTVPLATSGRWLTMEVGDLDGDGDPDVVLGSFTQGPASIPIPPGIRQGWQTNETGVLLLENVGFRRR